MTDKTIDLDITKYIEARLFGKRPHIFKRRIPVATIAYNARTHGWNITELAKNFSLSEAQVLAALLYYEENKEEIDQQETKYQAELDEMYHQHHD